MTAFESNSITTIEAARSPSSLRQRFDLSLINVETAPYGSLDIRDDAYPSWILSHVLSGCVETRTRGIATTARPGDVMIHPPNIAFSESNPSRGVHQWLLVDLTISGIVDLLRLYPASLVVTLADSESYAEKFARLEQSWLQSAPSRDLHCASQLLDLVAMVLDSWQSIGAPPRPATIDTAADRFASVLSFMHLHLAERVTRNDLAKQAFLHPGYFDRVFRSEYGMPPMQMLREIRLRRAAELLESTDQTLDAVAAACGLGDAGHLGRLFRCRFNATPGQHRESAKLTRQSYIRPLVG